MNKTEKSLINALLALFVYAGLLTAGLVYTLGKWHKAEVCNKVFTTYFKCNLGIHIDLDRLYEDGKKWVNDPQYQCD